jgi:hypothetical protein
MPFLTPPVALPVYIYGIQELEETLLVLTPAHTQALAFLNKLQNKVARTLLGATLE